MEMTQNNVVFLGRLLVSLKRAGCALCSVLASFSLADVLLPSRMHTTTFSIDQQLQLFVKVLESDSHWCAASSRRCVLYNVHTFLHQSSNSIVDRVSGSTGLFGLNCYLKYLSIINSSLLTMKFTSIIPEFSPTSIYISQLLPHDLDQWVTKPLYCGMNCLWL